MYVYVHNEMSCTTILIDIPSIIPSPGKIFKEKEYTTYYQTYGRFYCLEG